MIGPIVKLRWDRRPTKPTWMAENRYIQVMGLFDNNNFLLLEWSYLLPMESEENGGTLGPWVFHSNSRWSISQFHNAIPNLRNTLPHCVKRAWILSDVGPEGTYLETKIHVSIFKLVLKTFGSTFPLASLHKEHRLLISRFSSGIFFFFSKLDIALSWIIPFF